jgi:hypothetical protein
VTYRLQELGDPTLQSILEARGIVAASPALA